jgi:hypothetical protein
MAESVWAFGMIAAPVRLSTLLFRSLGQIHIEGASLQRLEELVSLGKGFE